MPDHILDMLDRPHVPVAAELLSSTAAYQMPACKLTHAKLLSTSSTEQGSGPQPIQVSSKQQH